MKLEKLPWELSVCKLSSLRGVNTQAEFFCLNQTDRELSLVCLTEDVPEDAIAREDGWRALRVAGALDFSLVGILADLTGALARAGIGLFALSTYDTDYILVKADRYEAAVKALKEAGHYEMDGLGCKLDEL